MNDIFFFDKKKFNNIGDRENEVWNEYVYLNFEIYNYLCIYVWIWIKLKGILNLDICII